MCRYSINITAFIMSSTHGKFFGSNKVWSVRTFCVIIFGLNSALVHANPATTPRIFPEDVSIKEYVSKFDTTAVRDVIKIDGSTSEEISASLDKDIQKLRAELDNMSDAENIATTYLEIEKIELLKEAISNVNDCAAAVSQTLVSICSAIENDVNRDDLAGAIKKYSEYIEANKSEVVVQLIDRSVINLNVKELWKNQKDVILQLVDMKRSIVINDEFDKLITTLSKEPEHDKRKIQIKTFFGNYIGFNEQELHLKTKTRSASISYADSLYKQVLADKFALNRDIWKGKSWIWNYLKYSDNLSKNQLSTFGGIVLGSSESNQTVKINALEYDIYFSDVWKLPLTLYFAEVVESADASEADVSRTKLLDSEMGTFNLSLSSIAKFRIREFCNFTNGYGCYFPLQIGLRALKLPSAEVDGESEGNSDSYSFGGYASIGLNTVFPITPRHDGNSIAGRMAISINYLHYQQSGTDLALVFPGVVDDVGAPAISGNSYEAFNVNALFTITDKITISARHYKGDGDGQELGEITSFEFRYNVD